MTVNRGIVVDVFTGQRFVLVAKAPVTAAGPPAALSPSSALSVYSLGDGDN